MVQQARGRRQDIGRLLFAALHAFQEKFRVGVAVLLRHGKPVLRGFLILWNAHAHEGQLYRAALQGLRVLLCADRAGQRGDVGHPPPAQVLYHIHMGWSFSNKTPALFYFQKDNMIYGWKDLSQISVQG